MLVPFLPAAKPGAACVKVISTIQLLFTLLVIPASLRYLERLWGAIETLKFVLVTIGVSNIIAFGLNWLEFLVLRNEDFL